MLADTFQHALAAARTVVVTVTPPTKAPNFTIAAAMADSSYLIEVRLSPCACNGKLVLLKKQRVLSQFVCEGLGCSQVPASPRVCAFWYRRSLWAL